MTTVTLRTALGQTYRFTAFLFMRYGWYRYPVIYAFARLVAGQFHIMYIGEAGDAADRFGTHERWDDAAKLGATHILTLLATSDKFARKKLEDELISYYQPPMNRRMPEKSLPEALAEILAKPANSGFGYLDLASLLPTPANSSSFASLFGQYAPPSPPAPRRSTPPASLSGLFGPSQPPRRSGPASLFDIEDLFDSYGRRK